MTTVKIHPDIEEADWKALQQVARESSQSVTTLVAEAIREYVPGITDRGLLDSALHRPQTGYYGDLAEMATAMLESLLVNRPFVDGNERIAFFATDVFLRMNGWRLAVEADEAHKFLAGLLERRECRFDDLIGWMRLSMTRL